MDASAALGRSAIAVASCGDAEKSVCDICGYVVGARGGQDPTSWRICVSFRFFITGRGCVVWVGVCDFSRGWGILSRGCNQTQLIP